MASPYLSLALRGLSGGIGAGAPCGQNTAQMAVVPPQLRSTTTALYEIWWAGGNSLGPVFAGAVSDALGGARDANAIRQALLIGSVFSGLHALIVWSGRHAVAREMLGGGSGGTHGPAETEGLMAGAGKSEGDSVSVYEARADDAEELKLLRAN